MKNDKDVQTLELTEDSLETISKAVVEGVTNEVSKNVDEKITEKSTEVFTKLFDDKKSELETLSKKNVQANTADDDKAVALETKKMFFEAMRSLMKNDKSAVIAYNEKALELREKAGYANTGVNADGGYVVMLPEFEAEIEKIVPLYGVGIRDTTVRYIQANEIKTNKRGSNVTMVETSEAAQKTGTKITIGQDDVRLRKFAGIATITDEMIGDAAIDFWAEYTADFAEEWARILDTLVFTDRVSSTYPGALYMPGINTQPLSGAITTITWDDLAKAEVKVPSVDLDGGNAKWYMHKSVWNLVRLSKDSQNRYQALPSGERMTPWGTPIQLVDVMPSSSVVGDSNEPYALFGNLKRVKLYIKQGLTLERSNEAVVHDSLGNAVNLWEKDMSAIRGVARAVSLVKFPEALVAVGTGTVS